jgi:uncharacterized protein (DUF952 family)
MSRLFHIVAEPDWRAACEAGWYAPASLARDGFVHLSYLHQVTGTANLLFADATGLLVIEIDPSRLDRPIVEEDLYGAGERFPHFYAAVPTSAAVGEHRLSRTEDGRYGFTAD